MVCRSDVVNAHNGRFPLPLKFIKKILTHTQAQYPLEACGFLSGRDGIVVNQYPIYNRLQSETEYGMEPTEMLSAFLAMETQEEELLAIYHSHPQGSPHPSPTDIAQAYYPDAAQIIVSLADCEPPFAKRPLIRAFMIKNGSVTPVTIVEQDD